MLFIGVESKGYCKTAQEVEFFFESLVKVIVFIMILKFEQLKERNKHLKVR